MKLLVSDYDQTLSMDDYSIKFNIKKIDEFRKNGNLFMLSTGREYSSIKEEIEKWNIKYDYLSCVDGTILFDYSDNLLSIKNMEKEDLRKIYYLKLKYGDKVSFYDVCTEDNITLERVVKILDFKYKQIIEDIKVYFDRYLENSSYTINFNNIYVKPRFINKSSTIEYLENKINIEKRDIFTIGDHNNDYEMIKDYNGFTMLWGTTMAREYAIKKYLFMSGLICDIENNNEKFVKKLRFR